MITPTTTPRRVRLWPWTAALGVLVGIIVVYFVGDDLAAAAHPGASFTEVVSGVVIPVISLVMVILGVFNLHRVFKRIVGSPSDSGDDE
jgi:uncharacterized membrane protein YdjX (TVP38/TMEM64 family)